MTRPFLLAVFLAAACGGGSNDGNSPNPPGIVAQVTSVVNNGEVQLNWSAVPDAIGYNVYMASQSGVTRLNVGTLPGNMTHGNLQLSFDHPPGLDANTLYYFVVTAQNSAGESAESCEVTAHIAGAQGDAC